MAYKIRDQFKDEKGNRGEIDSFDGHVYHTDTWGNVTIEFLDKCKRVNYEDGYADATKEFDEFIKALLDDDAENKISEATIYQIWGEQYVNCPSELLIDYSLRQLAQTYTQYQNTFHPGDIVQHNNTKKYGVVMDTDLYSRPTIAWQDGTFSFTDSIANITKTGKAIWEVQGFWHLAPFLPKK